MPTSQNSTHPPTVFFAGVCHEAAALLRFSIAARQLTTVLAMLAIAGFADWAAAQAPPALSYDSQRTSDPVNPTFIHSGINTVDRRVVVWDYQLADMAVNALRNAQGGDNYNEVAFAFLECFGGGMIDELVAKGLANASYTSAARHNQLSWAWPQPSGLLESTYGLPYAPKAGSNAPQTQKAAATFARANDFYGPFSMQARTDPQFTSDGAIGDAITLHRNSGVNPVNNAAYKSILWGGANWMLVDVAGNGNSYLRMATNMMAAGYADADVRPLLTSNPPATRTTFAGMAKAWKDLKAVLNDTTQVFFWSSWGHGSPWLDKIAKKKFQNANQAPKKGLAFDNNLVDTPESAEFFQQFQDIYQFWQAKGESELLPYFHMVSPHELVAPSVELNAFDLPLIQSAVLDVFDDGTKLEYTYSFAIDSLVFNSLVSSGGNADLTIDFFDPGGVLGDDLSFLRAGLTFGDASNGPATVPEPAAFVLAVLSGLMLLFHRRRTAKYPRDCSL